MVELRMSEPRLLSNTYTLFVHVTGVRC